MSREISSCCKAIVAVEISASLLWPYVMRTFCTKCEKQCESEEIEGTEGE